MRPGQRFSAGLFVLRRGFWRTFGYTLPMVLYALYPLLFQPAYTHLRLLLIVAGVALADAVVAWLFSRRQVVKDGTLAVGEKELSFNGQPLCARESIASALVMPQRRGKPVVVLQRRRGKPVRLEVDSVEQGRAIVRELELDPRRSVTTFGLPTMRRGLRTALFAVVSVIGILCLVSFPVLRSVEALYAAGASLAVYLAFAALGGTKLFIGGDGLRIRCLGQTRFVAHDEIASVHLLQSPYRGVELALRSGEAVRLPTVLHSAGDGGLSATIAERIEEARGALAFGAVREESLLARGGRAAPDWLRQIRALAAGAHLDHRTAPVDPERVRRLLENPAADPSARVGAAAMLAASSGEDRERLRIVARGITAPRVRVAMEAIAAGEDEEALIEALEAVEERRGGAT